MKWRLMNVSLALLVSWSICLSNYAIAIQESNSQIQLQHKAQIETKQFVAMEQLALSRAQAQPETHIADLWRAVRAGDIGYTPATTYEAGRLINAIGNQGRLLRSKYIEPALGFALVGVFSLFLLFYLINGPTKLKQGFSGTMIRRWSQTDVILHWFMAISCLTLMLTGTLIMLGRHFIEAFLPKHIWAELIYSCKTIHDWTGPIFILCWLLCMVKWMPKQTFKSYDLKWFATAGGYVRFGPFKGKHADSGFANAGEKMWFWTLALFGLSISVSGIMLVLPELKIIREISILALLLHGISAAILIAFTIVHIWMATVLSEGGLESMLSGYCDENWAIQHHNIWYEEIKANPINLDSVDMK